MYSITMRHMYSIVVRQHFKRKQRDCGFAILIGVKQDGIDESASNFAIFKTKVDARQHFTERVKLLRLGHEKEEEL